MSESRAIIENLSLTENDRFFYVLYNEKIYSVGNVLYYFLENAQKHDEFTALDRTSSVFSLSHSQEEELLKKVELFLNGLLNSKKSPKNSYFSFKVTLINKTVTNIISEKLSIVFHREYYTCVVACAIILSLFFLGSNASELMQIHKMTFVESLFVPVVLFFVLLFHEFGHTAASKYHGIDPNEIGLSFYLIFPALYSNVTSVWVLPRKKRIIVNLGGVSFQLLINIVLFIMYYILQSHGKEIIFTIIRTNTLIILISLSPFIRNDGYWIYSDYFQISNLNSKSNTILIKLFKVMKLFKLLFF